MEILKIDHKISSILKFQKFWRILDLKKKGISFARTCERWFREISIKDSLPFNPILKFSKIS